MVMMLRQCCCGCTLQTGAIIIGVFEVLGGLLSTIGGIAVAAAVGVSDEQFKIVLVAEAKVLAVLGAIMLVCAICLITGALKARPVLLLPWLVQTILYLIADPVIFIFDASRYFAMGDTIEGAICIIAMVIYISLQTYFLLVVYSLYRAQKGTAPVHFV